ncbi:MAG: hypothetical protein Q9164_004765 [Protoblastenia rupestris]
MILLRALGFELRPPLPMDYMPGYLGRAWQDVTDAAEDYDSWTKEEREEYGVLPGGMDTGMGKACRTKVIQVSCKYYQIVNFFPARAIALGSLYVTLLENGLNVPVDVSQWAKDISGRKVDFEDFEEIVQLLKPTASHDRPNIPP